MASSRISSRVRGPNGGVLELERDGALWGGIPPPKVSSSEHERGALFVDNLGYQWLGQEGVGQVEKTTNSGKLMDPYG